MKNNKLVEAGATLRELRKLTKLSVHKVENRIGVSGGYIAKLKREMLCTVLKKVMYF